MVVDKSQNSPTARDVTFRCSLLPGSYGRCTSTEQNYYRSDAPIVSYTGYLMKCSTLK